MGRHAKPFKETLPYLSTLVPTDPRVGALLPSAEELGH